MNLLEATATLIDAAKTYGPESDRVLQRSIKRMEKRLHVLQVRSAKARKRNRMKAFWDAMAIFSGGVTDTTRQGGRHLAYDDKVSQHSQVGSRHTLQGLLPRDPLR